MFTFDHVHLRSPDPDAAAAFYVEMLGAERVRTVPEAKGGTRHDLRLGGMSLFVSPITDPDRTAPAQPTPKLGLEHIGLHVTGMAQAVAALKAKGVEFTLEPTSPRPGITIAFLRGPDGVSIELLERS